MNTQSYNACLEGWESLEKIYKIKRYWKALIILLSVRYHVIRLGVRRMRKHILLVLN